MTNPIFSRLNIDDVSREAWRRSTLGAPRPPAKLTEPTEGGGRPSLFLSVTDKRLITNMLKAGATYREICEAVTAHRLARLTPEQMKSPSALADAQVSVPWLCKYLKREREESEAGVVRDISRHRSQETDHD